MSESKFKTMRHIEAVRNYLQAVACDLLARGQCHDQSKLKAPEVAVFEEYTPRLRGLTYGSDEYKQCMAEMRPAIEHHNEHNRHHPEHWPRGFADMPMVDLIELLCDWLAASKRHADGDIYRSIEINQKRFGYDDTTKNLLVRTVSFLESLNVSHRADES